eukprot:TRINITY_DN585_c1_g4_i1.p1 TRINITY_DN585_c1_g4~~TRINITY_DN585_c1_g4_i1.p1  ORF type:complete len:638 (+),score=185.48 TRINITY_DN585_c1_g4_i1:38-1915(+)
MAAVSQRPAAQAYPAAQQAYHTPEAWCAQANAASPFPTARSNAQPAMGLGRVGVGVLVPPPHATAAPVCGVPLHPPDTAFEDVPHDVGVEGARRHKAAKREKKAPAKPAAPPAAPRVQELEQELREVDTRRQWLVDEIAKERGRGREVSSRAASTPGLTQTSDDADESLPRDQHDETNATLAHTYSAASHGWKGYDPAPLAQVEELLWGYSQTSIHNHNHHDDAAFAPGGQDSPRAPWPLIRSATQLPPPGRQGNQSLDVDSADKLWAKWRASTMQPSAASSVSETTQGTLGMEGLGTPVSNVTFASPHDTLLPLPMDIESDAVDVAGDAYAAHTAAVVAQFRAKHGAAYAAAAGTTALVPQDSKGVVYALLDDLGDPIYVGHTGGSRCQRVAELWNESPLQAALRERRQQRRGPPAAVVLQTAAEASHRQEMEGAWVAWAQGLPSVSLLNPKKGTLDTNPGAVARFQSRWGDSYMKAFRKRSRAPNAAPPTDAAKGVVFALVDDEGDPVYIGYSRGTARKGLAELWFQSASTDEHGVPKYSSNFHEYLRQRARDLRGLHPFVLEAVPPDANRKTARGAWISWAQDLPMRVPKLFHRSLRAGGKNGAAREKNTPPSSACVGWPTQ